jgi:hypothetical protein
MQWIQQVAQVSVATVPVATGSPMLFVVDVLSVSATWTTEQEQEGFRLTFDMFLGTAGPSIPSYRTKP